MTPWLITGTGRCGTGYVAQLLTEAGYPCGHEVQCGIENWTEFDGPRDAHESSWLALHWLMNQHADMVEYQVLHVIRRPDAVIESLHRTRVMEDLTAGYGKVHALVMPTLKAIQVPGRASAWVGFVHGLMDTYAAVQWDVTAPAGELAKVMGLDPTRLEEAAQRVPRDYNSRRNLSLPRYARP